MQLSCDNVHIRNYMYAVANWGFSTITWKSGRPVSVKDQVSQKLKRAWCYSVVKQDWVWKLQVGWLQMTTNITQNFNVKILPLFLVWNWVLVVSKVVLILSFPCSALLVELVKYVFTVPGVSLFLSNQICQDPIEGFFGQQRQRGRVNENPCTSEFLCNTQALRVIGNTCSNIWGNCHGGVSHASWGESLARVSTGEICVWVLKLKMKWLYPPFTTSS